MKTNENLAFTVFPSTMKLYRPEFVIRDSVSCLCSVTISTSTFAFSKFSKYSKISSYPFLSISENVPNSSPSGWYNDATCFGSLVLIFSTHVSNLIL